MIVVDTNLLIHLMVNSPEQPTVKSLIEKDNQWIVPRLWEYEFRNAILKYVKFRHLALDRAIRMTYQLQDWLGEGYACPDIDAVMNTAIKTNCSTYDCEYVILAKHLSIKFATFDKEVLRNCPTVAVHPKNLL